MNKLTKAIFVAGCCSILFISSSTTVLGQPGKGMIGSSSNHQSMVELSSSVFVNQKYPDDVMLLSQPGPGMIGGN